MTVERGQQPSSVDLHASVRTELLAQIVAAQATLASAIAELSQAGGNLGPLAESRSHMAMLGELGLQLGTANSAALTSLRGEVAAAVATASSTAQQARTAATSAASAVSTDIAQLANASREQVNNVIRGMKDFDPYLQFDSKAEEEAYRKREEERRALIEAEQAKGTPQGDLNASGAAVGQMADAAAHGAGNSPEFQQRWDKLVDSTAKLRAQIVREGGDVAQFDARLRDDLRSIMKSKGVPDAQIDALLAAHPDNPLDAMKTFVAEQKGVIGEKEIGDLSRKAANYRDDAGEKPAVAFIAAPQTTVPASALDAMADLKALGVVAVAHDASAPPAHGVTASVAANPRQGINVRS